MRGGAVALLMVPALVWAQEPESGARTLHRHLDQQQLQSLERRQAPGGQAAAAAASSPWSGDGPPGLSVEAGGQEWYWTPEGPIAPSPLETPHGGLDPASGSASLDSNTDRVSALNYQASFEPSVVPWKRGVAHDGVVRQDDGGYSTRRQGSTLRRVRVGGEPPQAHEDRFWGSFLVRMEAGRPHPIPSVAPGQRVVQVLTEPLVDVEVLRDGADNHFLRGDEEGVVRVNMELAVDRFYFDGALDAGVSWERFASPERVLGDARAREAAARVLEPRGVDRRLSPKDALDALVGYYRDFEARPFPEEEVGGDRYEAISRLQVGVCRHRALAFQVSAGSLGLESRYVYNEAHAFVEVFWPGQGWRRIDLGGAADGFNYENMGSNSVHSGGQRDPFPQPQRYLDEILAFEAGGQESAEMSEAPIERGSEEASRAASERDTGQAMAASGAPTSQELPQQAASGGGEAPGAAPEPETQVEILEATGEVMRGASLRVRGRVRGAEVRRVEVLLVPAGSAGFERGVALGEAPVRASGEFVGEWSVPRSVSLGRWVIKARPLRR